LHFLRLVISVVVADRVHVEVPGRLERLHDLEARDRVLTDRFKINVINVHDANASLRVREPR
jgi:hypothetical protein